MLTSISHSSVCRIKFNSDIVLSAALSSQIEANRYVSQAKFLLLLLMFHQYIHDDGAAEALPLPGNLFKR